MIAIIDYGAGNIQSVSKALRHIGCDCFVTREREEILKADAAVLPGVGSCGDTVDSLNKFGIKDTAVPGDLTLHSLRHTYATRCIESGMPPEVLQNLLGHTDIKVTLDTYSDVFDNFQNENVAKVDEYLTDAGLAVNS